MPCGLYILRLSPESLNVVYDLAGLLACSLLNTFPLIIFNSGMKIQQS
jgi:hypothetical protein